MKDKIIDILKKKEKDMAIYFAYVNDRTNPEKYRSVVSFKLMSEMMAHAALHELVPEHVVDPTAATIISGNLGNVASFVTVQDQTIKISQEYETMLQKKEEYFKTRANAS